jgi:hypothetical protein
MGTFLSRNSWNRRTHKCLSSPGICFSSTESYIWTTRFVLVGARMRPYRIYLSPLFPAQAWPQYGWAGTGTRCTPALPIRNSYLAIDQWQLQSFGSVGFVQFPEIVHRQVGDNHRALLFNAAALVRVAGASGTRVWLLQAVKVTNTFLAANFSLVK